MNAPTQLEDRLRHGLQAAASALPPAEAVRGRPGQHQAHPPRKRWVVVAVSGAAAAAVVVAAVFVANRGEDQPDVRLDPVEPANIPGETGQPEPPGEGGDAEEPPAQDTEVEAANGMVPGQAVIVDTELRTYGPDGSQTGTVSLADLGDVQAASSDLAGGWVACGLLDGALVWYPVDGESVTLESTSPMCVADAVRVVDSAEGPTAIYAAMGPGGMMESSFHAVVLATGEDRELALPIDPQGFYSWSAATGRIALHSDEAGLQVFDLATGESLPVAAIDVGGPASDLVLSPDGTSVALLTGDIVSDATDLVVYDAATGAERYRESFAMSLEGAQLSYDGTTVAVGNYYDGHDDVVYPPVTVFDVATPETRHTIDVHGTVL
ncbi:MAG: YncE family protein [Acidimicrobiales bacterium]